MERLEILKLESLKKKLNDNYFTILCEKEDRVSYGVIVQDTIVSPYVLHNLTQYPYIGIEMIKHEGLERLCFYILKDANNLN